MNFTHTLSCLNWTRNLGEGVRCSLVKGGQNPHDEQKSFPVGSEHLSERGHFQDRSNKKSWGIKKVGLESPSENLLITTFCLQVWPL